MERAARLHLLGYMLSEAKEAGLIPLTFLIIWSDEYINEQHT